MRLRNRDQGLLITPGKAWRHLLPWTSLPRDYSKALAPLRIIPKLSAFNISNKYCLRKAPDCQSSEEHVVELLSKFNLFQFVKKLLFPSFPTLWLSPTHFNLSLFVINLLWRSFSTITLSIIVL